MSTDHRRAYAITKDQISDMRYFYWEWVVGLVGVVCGAYSVPLTQEALEGIKKAVLDEFCGEVEIEWDSYGMWQWWENMSPDWFQLIPSKPGWQGQAIAPDIKCSKRPTDFKEDNA
jgi:hypothetical protein